MKSGIERSFELLEEAGILVPDGLQVLFERYMSEIRGWNAFASLVSERDAESALEEHIADSLSLVPWVIRLGFSEGNLLDIGGGAGFPAIPMLLTLPGLHAELLERAEKKAAFLVNMLLKLDIRKAEVRQVDFPRGVFGRNPDIISARAVENPGKVLNNVLPLVREGAVFLCQTRNLRALALPGMDGYDVERIQDAWSGSGLRRGDLFVVRGDVPRGTSLK